MLGFLELTSFLKLIGGHPRMSSNLEMGRIMDMLRT
jgi:hypothetical protein